MQPNPQMPPSSYPAPPAPPKSRTGLIVAIVVVVVVVVIAAVIVLGMRPASTTNNPPPTVYVTITAINLQINGPSNCWSSSTETGGTVTAGTSFSDSWQFTYHQGFLQPVSCTIQSVSISTAGFSLVSSNAPLVVGNGATQTFTYTVQTPSAAYSGVMTVVLTVTSP